MQQKTVKCIKKMKTLVSKLGPNQKLPSLRNLGIKMRCSYPTMRKVFKILETEGYIANLESVGTFTAIHDIKSWLDLHKHYLLEAKTNIEVAKLLHDGGKIQGKYAILFDKIITAIDITNGETIKTSKEEVKETIYNPLALELISTEKGIKQQILMKRFIRQLEIYDLAKIVYRTFNQKA